jgi:hypothetical protein
MLRSFPYQNCRPWVRPATTVSARMARLVDDDHDEPGRSAVQVGPAAEQRIGGAQSARESANSSCQVAGRDPEEDRIVLHGQPGVTGPALTPELLE